MTYNYFCKRCGLSKDFDTKEEKYRFKELHRPKDPMYKFNKLRLYACDLHPRVEKGILVYSRF